MSFCDECPGAKYIIENFDDEDDRALALNVAQGLSGAFVEAVDGTEGLSAACIEEVAKDEVAAWDGAEEGRVLESHPGLVTAVYECEKRVTVLGECALHSIPHPVAT